MKRTVKRSRAPNELSIKPPEATSNEPSRVSLLAPFYIGKTYVIREADLQEPVQFERLLPAASGWEVVPPRSGFSEPFGRAVRFRVNVTTCPELNAQFPETEGVDVGSAEVEALIFPVGIGVLIARATCTGDLMRTAEPQDELRQYLAKALSIVACKYIAAIEASALTNDANAEVAELQLPPLDVQPRGAAKYLYPIVFTSEGQYGALVKGVPSPQHTSYFYGARFGRSVGAKETKVHPGWHAGVVVAPEAECRELIELDFIIALACWYGLRLMNQMTSYYLRDAFVDLAVAHGRITNQQSDIIRLAFVDIANATHPIRWTTSQEDLRLLDRIHRAWSSEHLWRNLEERTRLLAVHHDQLEEQSTRTRDRWLTFAGVAIGALTLASAISDVVDHIPDNSSLYWFREHALGVILAVTGIVAIGVCIVLGGVGQHRKQSPRTTPITSQKWRWYRPGT